MYQLNKVKVYSVGIFTLMILLYIFYFHFDIGGTKGSQAVEKQLNSLIKTHNLEQLRNISVDDATFNFLSNLPNDSRCERTTDNLGASNSGGYYATLINGRTVGVWMKISHSYVFGHEYTLSRVKLDEGIMNKR